MNMLKPAAPEEGGSYKSAHARILKPGHGSELSAGFEDIPFIPALELLAETEARLSDAEAAAVALALWQLLSEENEELNVWGIRARTEAISRRR
ncbi:MAG: hypothetical protein K1X83_09125 [Oligoflexia bacterium]|nr:hypothetical protein [Oligoflexia bacterium]